LQKSCEFGAQFAELQKKQIQLNLDLELAKENLQKAKDEVAAMGGNNLPTACLATFSFRLLNRVTPLEQMCVVKTDNSKLVRRMLFL
jgi:hypothetical protein